MLTLLISLHPCLHVAAGRVGFNIAKQAGVESGLPTGFDQIGDKVKPGQPGIGDQQRSVNALFPAGSRQLADGANAKCYRGGVTPVALQLL